jgi:hypothetical protein
MSAQITAEGLKGMTPEQIVKAQQEGRLDAILGVPAADIEKRAQAQARLNEQITNADAAKIDGAQEPGATGGKV